MRKTAHGAHGMDDGGRNRPSLLFHERGIDHTGARSSVGLRFRGAGFARGQAIEITKRDGIAVGKLDDGTQLAAHRLDVGAKRREQKVAALFNPRHAIL